MENLTSKQQEIIQSIKEQFSLINSSRPKKSENPLLNYANELNEARQLESEERAIISAHNEAILASREDAIKNDTLYLVGLLYNAGIKNIVVENNKDSIILSNKNYEMWISYDLSVDSCSDFLYEKNVTVYGAHSLKYRGEKYNSLDEIINLEKFKNNFKSMLNHSK